jgi:hypothetical protein
MASATYTFPLDSRASATDSLANPVAWQNIKGSNTTFFSSKNMAYAAYAGSAIWSVVLIVVDSLQIATGTQHADDETDFKTTISIEDGENGWVIAVAVTMLVMDIIVLVTQAIDLAFYHFTLWPLTSLTWFGQLNGTGLSSALLGAYMYYPHQSAAQRDEKLSLAIFSLAAHALFISSQFSVTIEYIIRKVK